MTKKIKTIFSTTLLPLLLFGGVVMPSFEGISGATQIDVRFNAYQICEGEWPFEQCDYSRLIVSHGDAYHHREGIHHFLETNPITLTTGRYKVIVHTYELGQKPGDPTQNNERAKIYLGGHQQGTWNNPLPADYDWVGGQYIGTTNDCGSVQDCYTTFQEVTIQGGTYPVVAWHNDKSTVPNSFKCWTVQFTYLGPSAAPQISVTKDVNKTSAVPGEVITYLLSWRNNGNAEATNIEVIDDFDERYLEPQTINLGGVVSNGKIIWHFDRLPVGVPAGVAFSAKVKNNVPQGTTILRNSFTFDSAETNIIQSNTVQTQVTVNPPQNHPPVADAGPDRTIYEGETTILDGSGSYDPDGDELTYYWECDGGTINNPTFEKPTFTAPSVSSDRTFTCTLTVKDPQDLNDSDEMYVTVKNDAPSLTVLYPNGGEQWIGSQQYRITWISSGDIYSQIDILIAGYTSSGTQIGDWKLIVPGVPTSQGYYYWVPSGVPLYLPSGFAIIPSKYKIQIREATDRVDAITDMSDDYFTISFPTVLSVRTDSASDIQIDRANLNGTLTDKGGAYYVHVWFEWGRTSSYGNETSQRTKGSTGAFDYTIFGLSQNTSYHFRAVADNGVQRVYGSDRQFNTQGHQNNPPIADAGSDREVNEGNRVSLDGSQSYDLDGDTLTYQWSCDGGIIFNPNNEVATFKAPSVSFDTRYYCSLSVSDGEFTSSDTMSVLVRNTTTPSIVEDISLSLQKKVKNLSKNHTKWYESVNAEPSHTLAYYIEVKSTGGSIAEDVIVKDTLPSNVIYKGNLKVEDKSFSGNITEGINIGDLAKNESKIITFEVEIADKDKFNYGTTNLINTVMAYNSAVVETDTAKAIVTKKGVAGISTGITNNKIFDWLVIPLIISILIIWMFQSQVMDMHGWIQNRKKILNEIRAERILKREIDYLKTKQKI